MKIDDIDFEKLKKIWPKDYCLLCGEKPEYVCIFLPDDPQLFGAAEGKQRLIRYCICEKCKEEPGSAERADKVLLSEIQRKKRGENEIHNC